jgi:hypothetical protein
MKEVMITTKIYEMKCPRGHRGYLYKTKLMDECVRNFCVHCGAGMIKKKLQTVGTDVIKISAYDLD